MFSLGSLTEILVHFKKLCILRLNSSKSIAISESGTRCTVSLEVFDILSTVLRTQNSRQLPGWNSKCGDDSSAIKPSSPPWVSTYRKYPVCVKKDMKILKNIMWSALIFLLESMNLQWNNRVLHINLKWVWNVVRYASAWKLTTFGRLVRPQYHSFLQNKILL